jgi:methyl-accepting chemotaxis protein
MAFRKRITTLGIILTAVGILSAAAVLVTQSRSNSAKAAFETAHNKRYTSYLLADELRQSSDDLTRLARTYVVTGDATYEQQYMDILAIRNGQKERPKDYHRIYWDFVAANRPVSEGSGVTRSLEDLMRDAGFSDEEFSLLSQAKANSDGLVQLEVRAMNAVKGLYKDEKGEYTVQGQPDLELARRLMHSRQYHQYKADIMAPIHDFIGSPEKRIGAEITALRQEYLETEQIAQIAATIMAVVMAAIGWAMMFMMLRPLTRLTKTLTAFDAGEHDVTVPETQRPDEFGQLAEGVKRAIDTGTQNRQLGQELKAMSEHAKRGDFSQRAAESWPETQEIAQSANQLMEHLDYALTEINQVLERAAEGNLSKHDIADLDGRFGETLRHADTARANLARIVTSTRTGADDLDQQAGSMSKVMDEVNGSALRNASTIKQAAETIQTVSESVSSTAKRAREVEEITDQARNEAHGSAQIVGDAVEAMANIQKSSGDIVQIVTVIDDIAFQTNLLALNAGVEAARAGQAGKGFAVVAAEVHGLAQHSGNAAAQIRKLIEDSSQQVEGGVRLVEQAGTALRSISNQVNSISQLISEIAKGAAQQSGRLSEVSDGVSELDALTRGNSDRVSQAASMAGTLKVKAASLEDMVAQFTLDMEQETTPAAIAAE